MCSGTPAILLLFPAPLSSVTVGLKPQRPRLGQYILLLVLPPILLTAVNSFNPVAHVVSSTRTSFYGLILVRRAITEVPPSALVKLSTRLELPVLEHSMSVSRNTRFDAYQVVFGNGEQPRSQDFIDVVY